MATEVLAIGTTAANSSDVTVAVGAPLTVCLKDAAGATVAAGARVDILLKDDAGQYFLVAGLTSGRPALVLDGAGVYRFTRVVGTSCGVFSV